LKTDEVKQLIREGVDVNTRNHNSAMPLMLAAYRDKDITLTLLNAGAGWSINWADQTGRTA
jgi:ankyrin repeat protein